jgi:hypothetical protein
MKARVPCQTVAGTFTTVASSSGPLRKKSHRIVEPGGPTEEPPTAVSDVTVSFSAASEAASQDNALYGASSPPFNASDASMLDVDAFDFGTGDFISVDNTTTSSATLNSPALVRSPLNTCGLLLDDDPGSDDTHGQMDYAEAQVQYEGFVDLACFGVIARATGSDTSPDPLTDHTRNNAGTVKRPAALPVPELDCRQRLLELHSLLFNELQCITHTDLVDALFAPDSASLSGRDKTGPGDNIVRRVLFASERLMELLGIIRAADGSRTGNNQRGGGKGGPVSYRERCVSLAGSGTGILLGQSLFSGGSTGSSASDMFPDGAPSFVDLPNVISFLTCYVGLLSVYRAVFTHIHEALRACEPIRSTGGGRHRSWPGQASHSRAIRGSLQLQAQQLPQQLTALTSQHVLGIRIQMEVMTHMLEQVDDAWAGAVMDDGAESQAEMLEREGGAAFGSPATTALLQSMLRYEGYACASDEGCRMGLASLMNLQKSIRKLLRSSNFAETF